jgi:hypothetical protein
MIAISSAGALAQDRANVGWDLASARDQWARMGLAEADAVAAVMYGWQC